MSADLDPMRISYKSLEEITREPGDGTWEVWADRWWSFQPGKGFIFYSKSPQCNKNKSIAEKVTATCYPGAEVVFVSRAYQSHDCGDYI